jgi:hypothetical protein
MTQQMRVPGGESGADKRRAREGEFAQSDAAICVRVPSVACLMQIIEYIGELLIVIRACPIDHIHK